MTTDTFRALVARMADELDHYRQLLMDDRGESHALAAEARAALAEPLPPADGEVGELVEWLHGQDGGMGRRAIYSRIADLLERMAQDHVQVVTKMVEPTDEELLSLDDLRRAWNDQADAANSWDELGLDEIIWWAQRQALVRWGRPAPQPIPVSERLPEVGDCDVEGRCWCYGEGGDMVGWSLEDQAGFAYYRATHWLPAHALPVPPADDQP